ncbi:cysteine--tRNA ligase, mitochondrial isoform X1 [Drosophila guanche]|uniref:cysteine--tRNA ligase, mitochondrial isoform X1 n=1 Tax=Drosophila guanche TaxID=7266 RepID=UPI001472106B|nr:cysteine--tRNA ligase, mitochondrial isoform X1 [Drosophila guanche]
MASPKPLPNPHCLLSFSSEMILRPWYWRTLRTKTIRRNFSDSATESPPYHWQKPVGQHTGITVYNNGMRRKVSLVVRNPNMVTWYTCGPTVYDSAHLGHASTYVKVDIIQRILRDYFKFNLVTAMNITDVDDKIIRKARESGCDWLGMARSYEAEFRKDMLRLNVKPPDIRTHVSSNMPAIVQFIEELIGKSQAYVTEDNSVYFDVSTYPHYGKLQRLGGLSSEEKSNLFKQNSADFALWKAKKEADEPSWAAPWGGEGRPGWHIECSAIAGLFFGSQLDFHAGGLDLRFPHHENEEAQCCVRYQTDQWVNYWMHTGQLNIAGDENKMSKSLGNAISISEMLLTYTADEFRMACLLSNYRNPMPYSEQLMLTARQTLQRFKNFQADLSAYTQFLKPIRKLDEGALKAQIAHMATEFDNSLRDDFDTARGISVLIDQMTSISRCINEQQADAVEEPAYCLDLLTAAGNFINRAMLTFGISKLAETEQRIALKTPLPAVGGGGLDPALLIADVLSMRGKLRREAISGHQKNTQLLAACDELRSLLEQHGIQIRDHKQGSSWVYATPAAIASENSSSSK